MVRPVSVSINGAEPLQGEYRIEREWIDVTSERAVKPNPSWSYVDAEGHYHAWADTGDPNRRLPTLKHRSVPVPCDGSCGGLCHGEGYDVDEYRCELCDEVVEPGYVADSGTKTMPGLTEHTVVVYGPVAAEGRVSVLVEFGDTVLFGFGVPVGENAASAADGTFTVRTFISCDPLAKQLARPKARGAA